ncbi:peptide/nickel transport system permease protein [Mesobacillus persicus]|uniref:Peptide/nickel transport system permease protein n=1 Tax=Mesobacillus persicus TaxID=930146 RepID=A0A1H8D8R2_9BACI|nr:ABC transporter permease [Mesobacillus persicus]SEN03545.1 peptide/nickel transport system permease protein [Mesobacillus persicus]
MSIGTVFKRLMAERLAFFSFIFLMVLVIISIIAPFIVPYDPIEQDLMKVMASPSAQHWLGTDELGRDIFSRLLMGTKSAIQAGLFAILIPLCIGVPMGILSGYLGGVVDDIFMRIVDGIIAIPAILLALGITGALGISLWNAMIAIGIVFTPQFARLARGQTLQIRSEPYVEAAKISGAGAGWIMLKHIIPNIAPPIVVQASFNLSFAILVEASLSFLGMGAQSPQISWGNMIQQAYSMINMNAWMIVYPGLAIILTVLAGNFLGDGLRLALDPKYRKT